MRFGYAQARRMDPLARPGRAGADPKLAWNAWMIPSENGIEYYPLDVDPRNRKSVGRNEEETHNSWLREYADWVEQNYGIAPPEDTDYMGTSAIRSGWLRKSGFGRILTYTISAENPGRSLRHIRDNLNDHVIQESSRRSDMGSIPVMIAVLRSLDDIPTVAEFTLKDFVEEDGDLVSLIRRHRLSQRQRYSMMASIATEMERLGQHDLADRMDNLIRTAQVDDRGLPADVSRRWRMTRDYYEPFRRSIIPRAMATERMLSKNPDEYSAAQQALDRWNEIMNRPENVEDLARWVSTGQTPLGAIEEERPPGRKFQELTGSWAMEDTMMDPLARRLGEPGLVHHSPRDRDRLVTWYERKMGGNPRGSIEADFRSTAPGPERLYELKSKLRRGPFQVKRNLVPRGRDRDSLQLLVQRLNEIGKVDPRSGEVTIPSFGRAEMFAPSWNDVESAPIDVTGRSHVLDPRDPMASARIDRDEIEEAIDELHGGQFIGRGKHSPQWSKDLGDWAENVLGRVRKMTPR